MINKGMRAGAGADREVSPCVAGVGTEKGKPGVGTDVGEQRETDVICADFEQCTCFWGAVARRQ